MPKHDPVTVTAKDAGQIDFIMRRMPRALTLGIEDEFRLEQYHHGYRLEESDHDELRRLGYFGITTK